MAPVIPSQGPLATEPTPDPQPVMFPVSVVIERQKVTDNRWIDERWQVNGVVCGDHIDARAAERTQIRADESGEQYLCSGFSLALFKDDCESYYYNLLAKNPSVFVVCHQDEEHGAPLRPFITTVSWDEAASYLEADTDVSSVAIPPEIYVWMERFVIENYVPEKRKKRKRVNWSEEPGK